MSSHSDSDEYVPDDTALLAEVTAGATYPTATAALHAVQDYALRQGKAVKVSGRSGSHRHISCISEDCPAYVRLYRRQVNRSPAAWYISHMSMEHTNCLATANPTRRQIASMPTFVAAVSSGHPVPARALVSQVQARDGIGLMKKIRTVYRARERVSSAGMQATDDAYKKIPSYLRRFADMNPGTTTSVETDSDGRFVRLLVAVKVFWSAASARQRVLGIDCAHSKCPTYSGVQMLLVGRDGEMRNVILAFALVPAEDLESYRWFFSQLRNAGLEFGATPIFCDRHPALLSVADAYGLELRYCTLHIIRNLLSRFAKFNHRHKNLVWQIQGAESVDEYSSRLTWLGTEVGEDVQRYIADIPPARWCVHANLRVTPLFGWRTSNFVESEFGSQLVKGMRTLAPFDFLETMCSYLVDACFIRSQNAAKWVVKGLRVTPAAQRVYDTQSANIGQYGVQHASPDICYVWNQSTSVRVRRRVNTATLECTCPFVDQRRIPCRHVIAALADKHQLETVFAGFDKCYTVDAYAASFHQQAILIPLDEDLTIEVDEVCRPAAITRRPGRPRTRRIRSAGESDPASLHRCSRCHQRGHNKRTCTSTSV